MTSHGRELQPRSARAEGAPRTLFICHQGALLDQEGLARWLAATTHLVGVVVLHETRQRIWRRIRREVKRVGPFRFLDVLAFRAYYAAVLARQDTAWEQAKLDDLKSRFPPISDETPVLRTSSPNSAEAEEFIRRCAPDIVIARCKSLLKERVFSIPRAGTFVMHPGICPEYRNAHGCFWAIANGELDKVGMTLLRIDAGVDTGPVYGYFTYDYDPLRESHVVIQHRVVYENLEQIAEKLRAINTGQAAAISTEGRRSGTWGQPWLSRYLAATRNARRGRGR